MTKPIRRVAVIGAGVMGSGIAAHFANSGIETILLDIVPPNLTDDEKKIPANRNRFAVNGKTNALKNKPAAFFHATNADLVTVGNTEDDLGKLANVDLVIEAIIEKLEPKQALFAKLDGLVAPDTIVASNTSGLSIAKMVEGRSDSFRKNFLVMHFFNPVRYMKLLEVVPGTETDPAVLERVKSIGANQIGKGVVLGYDTPNFIGNRIGVYSMLLTTHLTLEQKLNPEDVDLISGTPMGHPRSASFRTADIVGLDTFIHVADNCYDSLTQDPERDVFKAPAFMRAMVEKKLLGGKTKGGIFRKSKAGNETFDFFTMEYRPSTETEAIKASCKKLSKIEDVRERVKALVADDSVVGKFAWQSLSRTLAYTAGLVGEISDDIEACDQAMRWGYNWELGPFETWDAIGFTAGLERMKADGLKIPATIEKMAASGATSFYSNDGKKFDLAKGAYIARDLDPKAKTLGETRRGDKPVFRNAGAEAWDLGDGILGLTFTTKANSIDNDVIAAIPKALEIAEKDFRGVVIANEGDHFCVGANLLMVVMGAQQKQWEMIRNTVRGFQGAVQRIKYASVPVVAAPYGMAVGGGLEVCLASHATQAYCETYAGLVEVGVGLIPGGAGNLNMLWRALAAIPEGVEVDTLPYVTNVFKSIAMAKVSSSAVEAQQFGFFYPRDGISLDKARLVAEAKARAIGLAEAGFVRSVPRAFRLPGESGIATLHMMIDTLVAGGFATEYDAFIARKLATVLSGGAGGATRPVTEAEMLELEAEVFVSLCGEAKSQERMQAMLTTNKPLRN